MHDIRFIRENPDAFDEGLKKRGLEPMAASLITLDEERRRAIAAAQEAQQRRNALSKEIGQAKAKKDEARAQALMAEVAQLKERAPQLEAAEREASAALEKALAEIPNTPNPEVPVGRDEHDNVEKSRFGHPRNFSAPKQHFEIGEALGQMDFETAAKLSGSRFVVLKGQLARLERALGQFMLDLHTTEHGYTEVAPPLLVKDEVMFGTTQLPKFFEDQFAAYAASNIEATEIGPDTHVGRIVTRQIGDDDRRWLIPTAEVSLTNLVRDAITPEEELPLRVTALTPCFRAEAGAAGRDTRGMLRQHQFVKCELVSITTPEQSADEHERMLACAEEVLRRLDLPYRVVTLCTGDMGFASAKTYDIEVWLPGQGTYREISSCSVCTDFQARRMNARCRPKDGRPRLVHTLNGSGVAVGRALIAVMENYQDEDGSVAVPDALAPYMGGVRKIEGKA
ncbi:MAG TPA: serine--tRNA ligase [Beijerinckiaceae bacterium]|jgi:seryl-tRNA synthetase